MTAKMRATAKEIETLSRNNVHNVMHNTVTAYSRVNNDESSLAAM